MTSLFPQSSPFRWLVLTALCLPLAFAGQADAANRRRRPITKPKFNPNAEKVELFAGMKSGQFKVQVIPKDAKGGRVLVENTTQKPLTVQMPKGVVGVQVLKQLGCGGGGGLGLCGGGGGDTGGGQQGQQQPIGGGLGGGLGGLGGGLGGIGGGLYGGGGGGFFSVPPKRVVAMPYRSVCLAHGKPEPSPRSTYKFVPVEEFTEDKRLQELIKLIGTNKIHPQVAQAAAWHLTDDMSWRELALKRRKRLGGLPPVPYFNRAQLIQAQQLVGVATKKARERDDKSSPKSPRSR